MYINRGRINKFFRYSFSKVFNRPHVKALFWLLISKQYIFRFQTKTWSYFTIFIKLLLFRRTLNSLIKYFGLFVPDLRFYIFLSLVWDKLEALLTSLKAFLQIKNTLFKN